MLEPCHSCPLLGMVCVPHAFSRLGPVLPFSLSPLLILILSCVILALEKGNLYLSSLCFIHYRSSPCPPGLNLRQSQKEAALFLSPLLSPNYAALLGNTARAEQVLFCGVTRRWEGHSLREEKMPLIMFKQTQAEGLGYHSVARCPTLFLCVTTFLFSYYAVLLTRGSGGTMLLHKRTACCYYFLDEF